ncbi:MAG TPA: CsoS2 family carboxysome shell protein [Acetobacteraceae bacterium]|nr:CsoS2 family carboxysome shell protein [Acetobacteraceae bacterium]
MTAAFSPAGTTLSGREIALMRRQAMAQHGKAGIAKLSEAKVGQNVYGASRPYPIPAGRPSDYVRPTAFAANTPNHAAPLPPSTISKRAALERRQALSAIGKSALPGAAAKPQSPEPARQDRRAAAAQPTSIHDCGCASLSAKTVDQACACQTTSASMPAANSTARGDIQPIGKMLARARRAALSQNGKSGIKRVEQAARNATSLPGQDWQAAITKGVSGRQLAMQHRKIRALMGTCTTNSTATPPTAHVRVRPAFVEAPPKLEEGPTLSGNSVTGTMIDRSRQVTGNEAGACRTVTGIEYLPANMYDKFCPSRPPASPAKVVSDMTPKGKTISGTLVGRPSRVTGGEMGADRAITGTSYARPSADTAPAKIGLTHTYGALPLTGTTVGRASKVTGDEPGSCRSVTGSQYLSAEHFREFCRSEVPALARRTSVMSSSADQTLTGSAVGRSQHVTGDEAGSCRAITGNQYFNAKDFGSLCNKDGPHKVARIETRGGAGASGTQTASSLKMTGDEAGRCCLVTGIDYLSAGQFSSSCRTDMAPVKHVSKVTTDLTINGERVTGSAFGRSEHVTGDEVGACAPISGSSYIGQRQYQTFCPPESLQAQSARVRDRASIPASMVSGDRPGAGGMTMTGDERGACLAVTGAPYIGSDNMASACLTRPDTSNRFLSRHRPALPDKPAAPVDFSIRSPARVAWDADRESRASLGAVTGTAYGAAERITGPGNKAGGLITGTPEFRHHDFAPPARQNNPRDAQAITNSARVSKTQRLSGEAQIHGRVTGDAWHMQSRVSGTEGRSSTMRNPSQRGNPRGTVMGARTPPEAEKPPAATNLVTGSSGNTGRGPLVTVSGGARA